MSSKAQTLKVLKGSVERAVIFDAAVVSVGDWRKNHKDCVQQVLRDLGSFENLIVRSSSRVEDQVHMSAAGKFESVLNVKHGNLVEAIETVISSYGASLSFDDEILIQPMLQNVMMSGVLFTRDPNTGAPYYIINYDLKGDTTAVTSGKSPVHTFIMARSCEDSVEPRFKKLILLARELESKMDNPNLDIEFAFDEDDTLHLFQVRPLIMREACKDIDLHSILGEVKSKFKNLNIEHPYLCGRRTILGVMPDWNPAEIIGIRPKPLALSLYKELVTDSTWAYQRDNYGYKNLRSFPLLIDLMGLPYIDVRVSFNSFVPKELDLELANKLVDYYIDRLEKEPDLHDKVEFDIVFSCYTFDFPERVQRLKQCDFDDSEISLITNSLKKLTNNIIHRDQGLWLKDIEKVEELTKRHSLVFFNHNFDDLTKIYWLVEDCKRYGTLPFAGLARAGFIAVQLLNSMVAIGILTHDERLLFLNSLDSVSTRITRDLHRLDREHFLHTYGHLRPGTYDILSPRYDEAPDLYFDWSQVGTPKHVKKEEFKLSLFQMKRVETLLKEHGLDHDVVGLFSFMKAAIEGREYSKFIFTKTLSDILSLLKNFAKNNKIELEDLSYLDVQKFLKLYSTSWNIVDEVGKILKSGKGKHAITKQILLPSLIVRESDIDNFSLLENQPNFITRRTLTAAVITNLKDPSKMKGAVIFIPSADPGFDWIFTHGIAGFVTAYGGANSHMAIRASELGLPAIVGSGEKLYNEWKVASRIHIDCANQRVEVLH